MWNDQESNAIAALLVKRRSSKSTEVHEYLNTFGVKYFAWLWQIISLHRQITLQLIQEVFHCFTPLTLA